MKLIKVKIIKNVTPGQPRMQYPAIYNAQEVEVHKTGPIIYEGRLARGEDVEYCLLCVSDELANKYARDPDVVILNKGQANSWLRQNPDLQEQPDERVTDSDRLLAIIAKSVSGIALSQEDKDALDPDKKVRGVQRVAKDVDSLFPGYKG